MQAPTLEFVCEFKIKLKSPIIVGETPKGFRRIIPIVGGTFEGTNLKGEILEGGGDWQMVRSDGVIELEAHHQLKTDDGVLIYFKNTGIRVANPEVSQRLAKGEEVAENEYYFRTTAKFEAPIGSKYEWMNYTIFIAKGIRNAGGVEVGVWRVL